MNYILLKYPLTLKMTFQSIIRVWGEFNNAPLELRVACTGRDPNDEWTIDDLSLEQQIVLLVRGM